MRCLYKEADSSIEFNPLIKVDMEKGELTAVVYAPERRDAEGDIASADVIKEMAYSFQKNGGKIDIRHNEKPLTIEQAYVAETFIIQPHDPRFSDFEEDVAGGWGVLLKIDDPELRQLYREKKWEGISLHAPQALLEIEKSNDEEISLFQKLKDFFAPKNTQEIEMTKEELILNNKTLVESIVEGLAKVLKPAETKTLVEETEEKTEEITFEGDRLNKEHVERHLKKLRQHQLIKSVNFNDPKEVENYYKTLSKSDDKSKENKSEETPKTNDKITALEKQLEDAKAELAKEQKKSGQNPTQEELKKTERDQNIDSMLDVLGIGSKK